MARTQLKADATVITGLFVGYTETSITSSATPTPTGNSRQNFLVITAQAAAATIAAPTGTATNLNSLMIRVKDNATAQTIAWNAIFRAGTDIALPLTTVISKTMYLEFAYNSADTKWDFIGYTKGI